MVATNEYRTPLDMDDLGNLFGISVVWLLQLGNYDIAETVGRTKLAGRDPAMSSLDALVVAGQRRR